MDKLIFELLDEFDAQNIKNANLKYSERLKDLYTYFVRPRTGSLLRILNLDKHYEDGFQNYLITKDVNGKETNVLDLTGGYGANLLGHKNPTIINTLINAANTLAPSHTQASLRKMASLLSKKLSDMIETETSNGPWVTTLSNSGTEAVEAAIKICLRNHELKKDKLRAQNIYQFNLINKAMESLDRSSQTELFNSLPIEITHQYPNIKNLNELNYQIFANNRNALETPYALAALEGGYHGKSLGSLSITHNESFKRPFGLSFENIFINLHNFHEKLNEHFEIFIELNIGEKGLEISQRKVSNVAGVFIEPIQGEGGIKEISIEFAHELRKWTDQNEVLLVSDEIQSGLYRTGKLMALSHYKIHADIYTFSKGLGGGVAKIAATSCHVEKYPEDFGYLHTSTFAEDDISSAVALKVLEMLERDSEKFLTTNIKGLLIELQQEYPQLIKEVRGQGYMLAIEFSEQSARRCHELVIFDQIGFLGYFFASALLNNENIRTTPSMSNGRTLRIQPSLYFGRSEFEMLEKGLRRFLKNLLALEMNYFFKHIYPDNEINPATVYPEHCYDTSNTGRPMAVFFCHMITPDHAKTLVTSHAKIDNKTLRKKLSKVAEILDFSLLHREILKDKNNKEYDVVFMAHPITSEDIVKLIKTGKSDEIVSKIQRGISFVKSLGATTIGLGQFTSIVSLNGLKLDNMELNLTTGNAYTTAITVKAALKAANDKNMNLNECDIACVGMAGNIASVTASMLSDYAKSMTFIYHTDLKDSKKYQSTLIRFFSEVLASSSKSPFVLSVKKLQQNLDFKKSIVHFVEELINAKVLTLSKEVSDLRNSQMVITGASAAEPFIAAKDLHSSAIIIDIGVPPNVIKTTLKDKQHLTYIQGGLAKLPKLDNKVQSINTSAFPLKPGTSYACLAETIILTMAGKTNVQNIGELNKKIVEEIDAIATSVGFDLADFKVEDSL